MSVGSSSKEYFLLEILKFHETKISSAPTGYGWLFRLHYLEKEICFWAEMLRVSYWYAELSLSNIWEWNTNISSFLEIYSDTDRKLCKTAIMLIWRHMKTCPFEVSFYTALGLRFKLSLRSKRLDSWFGSLVRINLMPSFGYHIMNQYFLSLWSDQIIKSQNSR